MRSDRVHLGKSCYGWTFTADASHGKYDDFESMKEFLESDEVDRIENGYGEELSAQEFIDIIKSRDHPDGLKDMSEGCPEHHWCEELDTGIKISFSDREFF